MSNSATPWTVARQAPLFMRFSRQEYWSGYSLLQVSSKPRDGIWVSCIASRFFTIWATREAPLRWVLIQPGLGLYLIWVISGLPQGQGLWVQQTWVWHKPSCRRSPLTPPKSCQNLHRTGETDSWMAQRDLVHQDPGERSSDPTRDLPVSVQESGGVGRWWPAAGSGALRAAVGPSEGGCHYLHYLWGFPGGSELPPL